jgi:hypothetical protein
LSNPIVVPEGREVVQDRPPDPLVIKNPAVSVPGQVYVLPPSPVVPPNVTAVPLAVNAVEPLEFKITFPVVAEPSVKSDIVVVPIDPAPDLKVREPEMEAFPDETKLPFAAKTWNLAEVVEFPPIARS